MLEENKTANDSGNAWSAFEKGKTFAAKNGGECWKTDFFVLLVVSDWICTCKYSNWSLAPCMSCYFGCVNFMLFSSLPVVCAKRNEQLGSDVILVKNSSTSVDKK